MSTKAVDAIRYQIFRGSMSHSTREKPMVMKHRIPYAEYTVVHIGDVECTAYA
jgi:hypothetical protein